MKKLIIVLVLISTPSFAQQTTTSPNEQALGQKLLQEIQAGISCNSNAISLKIDLDKANAKIKELESKQK